MLSQFLLVNTNINIHYLQKYMLKSKLTALQLLISENKNIIPFRLQLLIMLIKKQSSSNNSNQQQMYSDVITNVIHIIKNEPQLMPAMQLYNGQYEWKYREIVIFVDKITELYQADRTKFHFYQRNQISLNNILHFQDESLNEAAVKTKNIFNAYPNKYQKLVLSCNNEIGTIFWVNYFGLQNVVHSTVFVQSVMHFMEKTFIFKSFKSEKQLLALCDSQNKCFVSIYQCGILFRAVTDIFMIQKLRNCKQDKIINTIIERKEQKKIILKVYDEEKTQIIQLAESQCRYNSVVKKYKYNQTFRAGSSQDNQYSFKCKYLSRKQFAINFQATTKQFFIVCLSQKVFTSISQPQIIKLTLGTIFYDKNNAMVQITSFGEKEEQSIQYEDVTLQSVPTQAPLKHKINTINYEYLSSELKNKTGQINYKSLTNDCLKEQIIVINNQFFLQKESKFLIKKANDIISNKIGRKILLKQKMKIFCDNIQIHIL